MTELAYSYAGIVKQEKQADGTLKVYGKATDDSIDIDKQICDDEWLKRAMPDWFISGGNIREQHSSIAAGVATDYEAKADGHYITALIVDPISVKKVETGVLKGFSIGIRSPRVIRDEKASGGRIVDGQIVEVSVVDRPANPNAKLMLAKAAESGELVAVEQTSIPTPAEAFKSAEETLVTPVVEETPAEETPVVETPTEEASAEETPAEETIVEEAPVEPGEPVDPAEEVIETAKGALASLLKFDQTAYDAAVGALSDLIIVEATEMKNGSDERSSIKELLHAIKHLFEWYEGEVAEGEVANPNPAIADGDDITDLMIGDIELAADTKCDKCDELTMSCKCSDKAALPESAEADIITKATSAALASVKDELDLLKSALDAEKEKASSLEQELVVAKNAAVAGGPKRTAVIPESNRPELLSKAAEYRSKAEATLDRTLAEGYRELAADLERKAQKGAN